LRGGGEKKRKQGGKGRGGGKKKPVFFLSCPPEGARREKKGKEEGDLLIHFSVPRNEALRVKHSRTPEKERETQKPTKKKGKK